MRTKTFAAITGVIMLGLVVSACGTIQARAQETGSPAPRTITVAGSGEAFLAPDIATISIGVRTEDADPAQAMEANNAQAQEIADALREMGVEATDIQTSSFNIYPNQQFDETGSPTSTTYVVENTVSVTVRDLDNLGELLGASVEAGANQIYGITFNAEDQEEARGEARQAAVEAARAKAEALAEAAGVSLGELQSISEVSGFPQPLFEGRGGAALEQAAAVPISPGQLTVTVEVSLVFAIE
jgi:uncharacterized protein YggE